MEVRSTGAAECEVHSVAELQKILNALEEDTMICLSLEVPDDE
ncbi:MAG: hypothetical protein PUG66_06380 [Clostridiales bacterium]|nr:hypothetical protein [Clostridiales bacterium]